MAQFNDHCYFKALLILMLLLPFGSQAQLLQPFTPGSVLDARIKRAVSARVTDPSGALISLDSIISETLASGDTLYAVAALMNKAKIFGHQANYEKAYDNLWRGQLLAEEADSPRGRIIAYTEIGRYFSFYQRRERALDYFERALALTRKLVAEGELEQSQLSNIFYIYVSTFRAFDDTEAMEMYLDSATLYYDPSDPRIDHAYLDFEKAFILGQTGKEQEAIALFRETIPWVKRNNPGYLTLLLNYLGDFYRKTGNFSAAERSYREAIEISESTQSHLDFSPIIHRQLASLYQERGDYKKANSSLERFVALDDRFFDSRSENNRPLLEIQDDYLRVVQEREKQAREERLKLLERDNELSYFKMGALFVTVMLVIVLAILLYLHLRSRHRAEKRMLQKERELELKKANEIVDLKNKELAASTLKLIAKDEFISDIQDRLVRVRENPDDNREVNSILRNIRNNKNSDENWQAFEARFIAVNEDFYDTLKQRYPKLTQGDLKLCALIKLNFSSKDVAKLMGISVESVHTTRYRLRKKLGLERKDNLLEFIAEI